MVKSLVHIKLSDTGWILEKLAKEISTRLPYVTYDMYSNGGAEIQYYMTYGCRQQRISPIEVAWYTHKEKIPEAAKKFDDVARSIDFCITHSMATENILRDIGVNHVQTISPGVDLESFELKVRIGVVGRTYHTGRKGEALVAKVMDIPGIEWHFTGAGWPGPAQPIPEQDLPAFYRSLDYVLVPALIEGGPMCVVEALACGCPVIAPPIGWVEQFPHIGYKLGDANDLRRVLENVVRQKNKLRESVESYTWDAYAEKHHALFCKLLGREIPIQSKEAEIGSLTSEQNSELNAVVAVHGQEMTKSKGGPSVRAPKTAAALSRLGVNAEFYADRSFETSEKDVVHVFNVWHPNECEKVLKQALLNSVPAVLSPIFLDLSEHPVFDGEVKKILSEASSVDDLNNLLYKLRADLNERKLSRMRDKEVRPGYFSSVRRLTKYASHIICLSHWERQCLAEIGADLTSFSIVKNPVDMSQFSNADPELFKKHVGVDQYVLCVGRIETRKNQALLALALREDPLTLIFVGHEPDSEYSSLVRKWAGPNVIFAGRIDPSSPLLASALSGARVFCLPSWSEGAPLAALEAAASGCNMVLSNRSSEKEYFGDLALYIDPADPGDIREKVLLAWDEGRASEKAEKLKALVKKENSWERYAEDTLNAYKSAKLHWEDEQSEQSVKKLSSNRVFVDLTTLAHHKGTPTGMARVEECLSFAFLDENEWDIQFISWMYKTESFVEIDSQYVKNKMVLDSAETAELYRKIESENITSYSDLQMSKDDCVIVLGSSWMRNTRYLRDIISLKKRFNIKLIAAIYDVIQWKFPTWYPKSVSQEFIDNTSRFLPWVDTILASSVSTSNDVKQFLLDRGIPKPTINIFRLGDEVSNFDGSSEVQSHFTDELNNKKFVLFVSTLDYRKNHKLLLEIWSRLIDAYGDLTPYLVLVGRTGWRGEETVHFLNTDQRLSSRVLLLQGVSDATIGWLYDHCLFTVYPSLYEGWGLPVAESLRRGVYCISSTGGSLPEVGGELVECLDPLDIVGWYQSIERYCFNSEMLEKKKEKLNEFEGTDWQNVAKKVLSFAGNQKPKITQLLTLNAGQEVLFKKDLNDDEFSVEPYLLGGWGAVEEGGAWTVGTSSMVAFSIDEYSRDITLSLKAKALSACNALVEVDVLANDVKVSKWLVGEQTRNYLANIPSEIIDEWQGVRVEFKVRNPVSPLEIYGSEDSRKLGLRVESVSYNYPLRLELENWGDVSGAKANQELLFSGINNDTSCEFLGLVIDVPEKNTLLTFYINGVQDRKVVFSQGENTYAIHLKSDWKKSSSSISLFLLDENDKVASIVRAGIFLDPPVKALNGALRSRRMRSLGCQDQSIHVSCLDAINSVTIPSNIELGVDSHDGLVGGWHAVEEDGVWTNGSPSTFWLKFDSLDPQFIRLNISFEIYPYLLNTETKFLAFVGDKEVNLLEESISIGSQFEKTVVFSFSDESMLTRLLPITLYASNAIAPIDLGVSRDVRPLSLKLLSIKIEESKDVKALFLKKKHQLLSMGNKEEVV